MTVWRIALDRPTQSRGEVWRQTLRWRSGGSPPPVRRLCPRHSFGGGDGPAHGADGRAPGPKAPSQHRPRRRRGTIACTTGTAPVLGGGLQIAPPSCRGRAAKGEPGAGAERSGTVRFEHGCDRVGPRGGVSRSVEPVARRPGPGGRNAGARTMHGSGRPVAQAAD